MNGALYDERTFLSFFKKTAFNKISFLFKDGYGLPIYEMITARWQYNFQEAQRLVRLSYLWSRVSELFKVKLYQCTREEFELSCSPPILKLMWDIDQRATIGIVANSNGDTVEKYLYAAALTNCREMVVVFSQLRGMPTFVVIGMVELFNRNHQHAVPICYEISPNARGEYFFVFERETNELTSLGNANLPSFTVSLPLRTRSICSSNGVSYGVTDSGEIYKFDVLDLLNGRKNVEFLDFDKFFLSGRKFLHCEANDDWRVFLSCDGKYYRLSEEEVLEEISASRGVLNCDTYAVSYIRDRVTVFAYVYFRKNSRLLVYDIVEQGKLSKGKTYDISDLKKVKCVYFEEGFIDIHPCLIYETENGNLKLFETRKETIFDSLDAYVGPLTQMSDGTLHRDVEPFYENNFISKNSTSVLKITLNDKRLHCITRDHQALERMLRKNKIRGERRYT